MNEIWMATKREFYKTMWAGLLDGKRFIEIRKIVNKGESKAAKAEFHNDLDGFLEAAKKQQKGVDYYFGAHLRDTPDGTRDAVSRVTTLHADLDYKDRPFAEWQQKLKDFNPQVTVVIETGHGIHGYWFLEKPLHLEDDKAKDHFESVQKGLQQALGADATHDLPRILRVPTTTNYKDRQKPIQSEILFADYERTYRLTDFNNLDPGEGGESPKVPAVEAEIIEWGGDAQD